MTSWLKWRLCALFGTSLLIGGATYLHAQNDYPPPPKTPEAAGEQFFQLLSTGSQLEDTSSDPRFNWMRAGSYMNSISRQQMQNISNRSQNGGPERLLALLAQEMNEPQFDTRVSDQTPTSTIVEVSPATQSKGREVVVIAEDGGYRVDLKATYGRWNNLSGEKLDEEWFKYTGEASSSLSQNANFLRSQCQTQMKQQMLGIMQYTQDYDERYPPARQWIDVLQPYVRSEQIFKCPSLSKGGNGYAYNQNFSRIPMASLVSPATTINIYETSNPRRNWFGPGTGRAYRHLDGWNLAFADGHVKWLSRGANMNTWTFLPEAP
ncbi:hypothetical protein IAD21_05184 [Abditibacteriota bacterium]|nr:hypothetical protein IAD21_05184 [Abditibacteriota bacterium]